MIAQNPRFEPLFPTVYESDGGGVALFVEVNPAQWSRFVLSLLYLVYFIFVTIIVWMQIRMLRGLLLQNIGLL